MPPSLLLPINSNCSLTSEVPVWLLGLEELDGMGKEMEMGLMSGPLDEGKSVRGRCCKIIIPNCSDD